MRRLVAVAALLVTCAACSGGGSFPSLGQASSTTASPHTTVPAPVIQAGTGNPFCEFLRTYNDRFSRFNAGLAEQGQLRSTMNEAAAAIRDAENSAPAEVKADLTTMRVAFEGLIGALEQVNFDISRLQLERLTNIRSPEFIQASQRIDSYTRQHCV